MIVLGQAACSRAPIPNLCWIRCSILLAKPTPRSREAYLAGGQLALDKHDYALAAKRFEEGLKQLPDDPDLRCGLAQAYAAERYRLNGRCHGESPHP